MTILALRHGAFSLRLSSRGGTILDFRHEDRPLLRAGPDAAGPLQSACFPLVPFGNRLRRNQFSVGRHSYRLEPNASDPLYLHGDGWLGEWDLRQDGPTRARLCFTHEPGANSPYAYEAQQRFELREDRLVIVMTVINRASDPLPYGLGWHPYFPMTAETLLAAPARRLWTEGPDHLPDRPVELSAELDFGHARALPKRWINMLFEDWTGEATILWPERSLGLAIDAEAPLRNYMLFRSDRTYDPTYEEDWFCFEPMSHLVDGHHLPDFGGLRLLQPDESLEVRMSLRPFRI